MSIQVLSPVGYKNSVKPKRWNFHPNKVDLKFQPLWRKCVSAVFPGGDWAELDLAINDQCDGTATAGSIDYNYRNHRGTHLRIVSASSAWLVRPDDFGIQDFVGTTNQGTAFWWGYSELDWDATPTLASGPFGIRASNTYGWIIEYGIVGSGFVDPNVTDSHPSAGGERRVLWYRDGGDVGVWTDGEYIGESTGNSIANFDDYDYGHNPGNQGWGMSYENASYDFVGSTYCLLLWNRVLSDTEIKTLMADPYGMIRPAYKVVGNAPQSIAVSPSPSAIVVDTFDPVVEVPPGGTLSGSITMSGSVTMRF